MRETRTARFSIPLKPSEKAKLASLADYSELSMAQFAREILLLQINERWNSLQEDRIPQ